MAERPTKQGVPLDMGLLEILNSRLEQLAVDPVVITNGRVWYNTTDKVAKRFENGAIVPFFSAADAVTLSQHGLDIITAQNDATQANTDITAILNNNLLLAEEKAVIKDHYDLLLEEQSGIVAVATLYGIGTELTDYNAAVTALTGYLTSLNPLYTDFAQDSVINGATFRGLFNDVYGARQVLTNVLTEYAYDTLQAVLAIANNAKNVADNAAADVADIEANRDTFEATPVPAGDLSGTVVPTQANVVGQNSIYKIAVTGRTTGTAEISANGVNPTLSITFPTSIEDELNTFVLANAAAFAGASITLTSLNDDLYLECTAGDFATAPAVDDITGDLTFTVTQTQTYIQAMARVDTITLSGTAGSANILCDAVTKAADFYNSLEDTASTFVALYAAAYLVGGVVLTSSGDDIIFTSSVAGTNFTGATTITNVPNVWRGSIRIAGIDIWEDTEDNDTYGVVRINYKGYLGSITHRRITIIGSGRGSSVAVFSPEEGAGGLYPGLDLKVGALKLPSYADNAARDAAITSPARGMMIFKIDSSKFQGYTGASWVDLH